MFGQTFRAVGISLACCLVASAFAVRQAEAQDEANTGLYFTGELSNTKLIV